MSQNPLAGKPVPDSLKIDVSALESAYYDLRPDPENPRQRVTFGTSGHRGSSLDSTFNEAHILAVTQAICDLRGGLRATGPLFLGRDTHALSGPAQKTALEVLAGNGVDVVIQSPDGFTPTPVISHAILMHNIGKYDGLADGIVITPSHNPPRDGGFKYNPVHGGPAAGEATAQIEARANQLLANGLVGVRRTSFVQALKASTTRETDLGAPYIEDLANVVDLDVVRSAGLSLGVDPLGGASVGYWGPIAELYGLNLQIVNPAVDPTFSFMRVDHDGKVRMDCSSKYAMAGLIEYRDRFDIAFGNDPDADRHGIVTRKGGLLDPNHFLSVAIDYLFRHRPRWGNNVAIAKTLVSSSLIDRIAADLRHPLVEVPVGFKWFVDGLLTGDFGFGGEESAGASFLRMNGKTWTTDKDGIVMDLLSAEITARMGRDPAELYDDLTAKFGKPAYRRIDSPATAEVKAKLKTLNKSNLPSLELAGGAIKRVLTHAPGNGAAIGGVKIETDKGWVAVRPSGTEDIVKVYGESFDGDAHLSSMMDEIAGWLK